MANNKEQVKLVGFWVSSFASRVEWALKLKGVDFEYIEEDIFNKSSLLLELNPVHRKVPVLVHGQAVIAESFVILEYIDETWKQCPLLPQDPYERAMARFWAMFAEERILGNTRNALFCQGEEKENAIKQTIEALEKFEELLKKVKEFIGGEKIGFLDIAAGWISHWLPVWEEVGSMKLVDPQRFPATISWMNKFVNHPVVKGNLPPRDKMIVYYQNRIKKPASN